VTLAISAIGPKRTSASTLHIVMELRLAARFSAVGLPGGSIMSPHAASSYKLDLLLPLSPLSLMLGPRTRSRASRLLRMSRHQKT